MNSAYLVESSWKVLMTAPESVLVKLPNLWFNSMVSMSWELMFIFSFCLQQVKSKKNVPKTRLKIIGWNFISFSKVFPDKDDFDWILLPKFTLNRQHPLMLISHIFYKRKNGSFHSSPRILLLKSPTHNRVAFHLDEYMVHM